MICVPIIGCVPTLEIFSANSNAPHKLEVSERPKQGTLFSYKNPLGWLDTRLNAVEHLNFFEGRVTEYSKAFTRGTWVEAFS